MPVEARFVFQRCRHIFDATKVPRSVQHDVRSIGGALSYGRHHNGDGGFEIKDSPDLMDPDAKPTEQDDKKELKCYHATIKIRK